MANLKEHQINVFVNDGNGDPIGGATIRVLDNDEVEKEEIGKAILSGGKNLPARFTLSEQYKSVILIAEVEGVDSQQATVGADVGNYTFTFPEVTVTEGKPRNWRNAVETRLLTSLGKIAGLAGIALGVFLLLFQGVLKQKFLPQAGLTSGEAYHVILALMILTFGIAAIGVVAWIMGQGKDGTQPVPLPAILVLAALVVAVLVATATVGAEGKSDNSTFPVTFFVHGPGGPQDTVPPNSGDVVIDLGGDRRKVAIGEQGQAYFPGIPASFRGQEVLAWVSSDKFESAEANKKYKLEPEAVYLGVRSKPGRLRGLVKSEYSKCLTGVQVQVAGLLVPVDPTSGRFDFSIPGDHMQDELVLDVAGPGCSPQHLNVVPNSNEITITLRRKSAAQKLAR